MAVRVAPKERERERESGKWIRLKASHWLRKMYNSKNGISKIYDDIYAILKCVAPCCIKCFDAFLLLEWWRVRRWHIRPKKKNYFYLVKTRRKKKSKHLINFYGFCDLPFMMAFTIHDWIRIVVARTRSTPPLCCCIFNCCECTDTKIHEWDCDLN